jgi:hypothetical protein
LACQTTDYFSIIDRLCAAVTVKPPFDAPLITHVTFFTLCFVIDTVNDTDLAKCNGIGVILARPAMLFHIITSRNLLSLGRKSDINSMRLPTRYSLPQSQTKKNIPS